jgi:hypothetical protein
MCKKLIEKLDKKLKEAADKKQGCGCDGKTCGGKSLKNKDGK